MRLYAITYDKVVIRFYLMMGCVLLGMFSGYYAIALLALPLFLSAILGVSFKQEPTTAETADTSQTKVVQLPDAPTAQRNKVA